jgi:hypothetical protein
MRRRRQLSYPLRLQFAAAIAAEPPSRYLPDILMVVMPLAPLTNDANVPVQVTHHVSVALAEQIEFRCVNQSADGKHNFLWIWMGNPCCHINGHGYMWI